MNLLIWIILSGFSHAIANDEVPKQERFKEFKNTVRKNINQIRHCYEVLLQKEPNASGKAVVRISVFGKTGRIKKDETYVESSTIEDISFKECLLVKVKRWKFPISGDDQDYHYSYPFIFEKIEKKKSK